MTERDLRARIAPGEDSSRKFTVDIRNAESLAAEIAAFANAEGGIIYIGIDDKGTIQGLSSDDTAPINKAL